MFTIGKEFYKGDRIPVCIRKNKADFFREEKRYHIFFVESGAGSISYDERKELFMGPLIFCFHEKELPLLNKGSNIQSRSLYLSPEYVNNRFSFDNLRTGSAEFTLTDNHDRNWFRMFFERTDSFHGRINLSLATAKRMSNLFDLLERQLERQPDPYWPCRGRSFLIEILFLIEQNCFMEDSYDIMFASGYSEEVEKVILYLYNNYGRKITLSELVNEFAVDRNTLTKKFHEEVGDSIISCLIKIRINMASIMLRDTLLPVSEIMYRVGFMDLSHFNRTFKKNTDFNPSEYRQKYNILLE
jgi:AraC-like DNA-binding protein